MNNVILHFPDLEPTEVELDNLQQYWHNLNGRVYHRLIGDLSDPNDCYQVKLIDFGLSKTLEEDDLTNTPVGVQQLKPPEMDQNLDFNRKVDTWNAGVLCFMLIEGGHMFSSLAHDQYDKERWSIQIGAGASNISIDCLKLVSDSVVYNMEKRPFPELLIEHPYFQTDLSTSVKINQLVGEDIQQKTGLEVHVQDGKSYMMFSTVNQDDF